MKKHYLLLAITMLLFTVADAAERTWQQKKQIAQTILGRQITTSSVAGNELKLLKETEGLSVLGYDNGGFAVISNDDRCEAVLGWSTARYNTDNMPDGLKWWLSAVDEVLSSATDYVREYLPSDIDPSLPASVTPMLTSVWGQSEPFNLQCPHQYPSGCVATAMAQIMYYHKYPVNGNGFVIGDMGAVFDFSNTTYEYDKMLPDYRNGYSIEQGNAVATLMRHCGVAVSMNYASSGSGAFSIKAALAMHENFLYNENLTYRMRDYHKTADWMKTVYGELAAGRPILYGAQDARGSGGHAFVFDGYREDGLVSVNWGWDGEGNGYYDIELLNPDMIGSTFEYSEGQDMIVGLGLPDETIEHHSELVCGDNLEASFDNNELTVNISKLSFYNLNIYDFTGNLYIKLTGNGRDYTLYNYSFAGQENQISMFTITGGQARFFGKSLGVDYTGNLPANLPDGTYTLYLAVQDGGRSEITPVPFPEGTVSSYTLTKTGSNITLEPGDDDTTSGINGIVISPETQIESADDRIYSIDGRYVGKDVNSLGKGLYIRNGKKFVKK